MRNGHDDDRRHVFASELWRHGCIVLAICLLAALISSPVGW
jgi:hypothetical protein